MSFVGSGASSRGKRNARGGNSNRGQTSIKGSADKFRGIKQENASKEGSDQSVNASSKSDTKSDKGVDEVKVLLIKLKGQIEKDEYDPTVFAKKPGRSEEAGKYCDTLKDICSISENKKSYHRDLFSQVETLCLKLHKACEDLGADSSEHREEMSPLAMQGQAVRKKESSQEKRVSAAIANAEKLIKRVEKSSISSDTKVIRNKKAEKDMQKADQMWKSKFTVVTEFLNKLEAQISKCSYDENDFSKPKGIEGSHEEVNKCKNVILDCCRKLKNQNNRKTSIERECKSLLNEITNWNETPKQIDKANDSNEDELEKELRNCRVLIFKRKKDFKSANVELQCLTKELEFWNDDKDIKDKIEQQLELANTVRDNRLKIVEKKKHLHSENHKKGDRQKEIQKQEQAIKKLYSMIHSGRATMDEVEISSALDEIKKYISNTQEELNELTLLREAWEEMLILQEEIKMFDNKPDSSPAKIDTKNNHLWVVRKSRIALFAVRENLHKGSKNSAKKKTEYELSCWKKAFGSEEGFKDITGNQDVVETIISRLTMQQNNVEKLLFKLEETSHKINSEVCGTEFPNAVQQKTPVDVLNSVLEMLERCLEETNTFAGKIKTLEDVLNIQSNNSSISNKCILVMEKTEACIDDQKQIKTIIDELVLDLTLSYTVLSEKPFCFELPKTSTRQTLPSRLHWLQDIDGIVKSMHFCIKTNKDSFHKRFVDRKYYDSLKEEKALLYDQMKKLEADKDSAYNRLSKVAGARLTDNNPNIADLSDPNRPTKIAEQYSELYDSPWTDAFEILKKEEQENTETLLKIIVDCYGICGKISKNHQQNLNRSVCFPADNIDSAQAANSKKGKKENPVSFSAVQSKALSELRKQTADISVVDVISEIKSTKKDWYGSKKLGSYTTRCIELCWLMHVQTPPVVIDTSAKSGSNFDTSRYRQYTKAGKKIDFIVWPVLLLEEGGAVLCKGVAQGK